MTPDQEDREHQPVSHLLYLSLLWGVSNTSVYRILTRILQKRKVVAKWVPDQLREEKQRVRMDIAQQLLLHYSVEGDFLKSASLQLTKHGYASLYLK